MAAPDDLIAEARTWLGTPFRHQGRVKGAGVDCAGLIICAAQAVGLGRGYLDFTDYARQPDGRMARILDEWMLPVPRAQRSAGDVGFFFWARLGQHVGLLVAPDRVLHAFEPAGGVVENTLSGAHARAARRFYRFREFSTASHRA